MASLPPDTPESNPHAPEPPKGRSWRRWLGFGAVGLLALFIIALSVDGEPGEQNGSAAEAQATNDRDTDQAESTATLASDLSTSFGNGTHIVGEDIAPGTYRAPGGEECRWARLSGLGGSGDDVLGFNSPTSVSQIVTIDSSDAGFESRGCGQWTRSLPRSSGPPASFGDGTHIVGEDVSPGTYRAPGGEECRWARLSGFGGGGGAILGANAASFVSQIATIDSSDAGFESSGCGQWTRSSPRSSGLPASFGDGTHVVGEDISPGTYRASGDTCYWVRLRDFSGSGIVDAGFGVDSTVTIESTDAGFESRQCGTWTRVNDTSEPSTSQSSNGSHRSTNASFGDGIHRVGTDIAPGTYRAPGGDTCYWARLSGLSGEIGDVIANGRFSPNPIVAIASSDIGFETSGCGTWTTASDTSGASASQSSNESRSSTSTRFGDGTHRVGIDIAPGTYRASGDDACYWMRLSGFSGEIGDVIANGRFNPNPTVTIASSDIGFETSGCGTWTTASGTSGASVSQSSNGSRRSANASFGDGTHRVGTDIAPGTYRAPGGEWCSWARLSGFGGGADDILGFSAPYTASQIVTIRSSDAGFETSGCGQWTQSSPRSSGPSTSFSEGTYIVGEDIQPGTYHAPGGAECYWARLSGFGGDGDAILDANAASFVSQTVMIESSDTGFESHGCGQWMRQ